VWAAGDWRFGGPAGGNRSRAGGEVAPIWRRRFKTKCRRNRIRRFMNRAGVSASVESVVSEIQRRFRKETSVLKERRARGRRGCSLWRRSGVGVTSSLRTSCSINTGANCLRSYAVEAVARPTLREKASADDAREFLLAIEWPGTDGIRARRIPVARDQRGWVCLRLSWMRCNRRCLRCTGWCCGGLAEELSSSGRALRKG